MKQAVEIFIEQQDNTASTAFAEKALAASGYVVSKARKHGRRSTSVDQAVDSYFSETAAAENARVLKHAIENGILPAVDADGKPTTVSALKFGVDYAGKTRQDTYDAIRGMCNADERFRPSVDSTLKLGSRIKNLLDDFNAEIRLADIKLFVQQYLTDVYLKSDGVAEYLTIDQLNPQTVEEQAAAMDEIEIETAEA